MSDLQMNPSAFDRFRDEPVPFLELLGIERRVVRHGYAAFRMKVDERHLRTLGLLHGGVTATLMDTTLGCAASTVAPADKHVVTVQLNINYVRPAWVGEELITEAEVRHAGQQTAVARGEVHTAEGELVAQATGTFMFLPETVAEDGVFRKSETKPPKG